MILKYIIEDIEAVKKYYPNIPDETFQMLISLDPTYREGSKSLGKYGKWILNIFKSGRMTDADVEEIPKVLELFRTYGNRLQTRDLNSFKTVQDLSDAIADVIDDESMLTPRQRLRFHKNQKAGRVVTSARDDYDVVFEDSKFIVYTPNTHEASMYLGKGTDWCTAHENPEWYKKYTRNGRFKLYIIKNKQTGERYQYTDNEDAGYDILDQNDEEFDYMDMLSQDKELQKFFSELNPKKFSYIDNFVYGNVDGVWTDIPDDDKCRVMSVTITPKTGHIYSYSFDECANLKSVEVPESVQYIYKYAFYNCRELRDIKIPKTVQNIGDNAFTLCENMNIDVVLTEANRIGDEAFDYSGIRSFVGVCTEIGNHCFEQCNNLKTVKIGYAGMIGVAAFNGCQNLEVVDISNTDIDTIYPDTFSDCDSLKIVKLPLTVERILGSAFYGCNSLEKLYLPDTVEDIVYSAFTGCTYLTIYSDSEYVKEFCEKYNIPYRPGNEY